MFAGRPFRIVTVVTNLTRETIVEHLTTREIADQLGAKEWQVRRLFEVGRLPEPPRFAGKRAIPRDQIPAITSALQERGWLPGDCAASVR